MGKIHQLRNQAQRKISRMCDKKANERPAAGLVKREESYMNEIMELYDVIESAEYAKSALIQPKIVYPSAATMCSPNDNLTEHFSTETRKGRFLKFRERFLEELYSKKGQIGCIKATKAKPDSFNNYSHTYGRKYSVHPSGSHSILDNKTRKEIIRDSKISHPKYLKSHKHYLPAEKIKRGYIKPFDLNNSFGMTSDYLDMTKVQRILDTEDKVTIITKRQKDELTKKFGVAGIRQNKIETGDHQKVFGLQPIVKAADVKTVFDHKSPEQRNKKLSDAVQYAHHIRLFLARKYHIDISDFKAALIKSDIEQTGYITLKKLQDISTREKLCINIDRLMLALEHFDILKMINNVQCVNIYGFFNFVTGKIAIPFGKPIEKLETDEYLIDSVYREMCKDLSKKTLSSTDEKHNVSPYKNTVQHLIHDGLCARHGLTPDDFVKPRSKAEIREIFSTTINTNFDRLWEKTLIKYKSKNNMLSVGEVFEMMKQIIQKKVT
ncbi:uncharacterized protein LOC119661861 [Teleopsis dalmanni]|uniref:uncharacterized protein LOC119661861 n=1 Tax=Teleopsis dalmanni TaxID=139649 RepID=UPI0018CF78F1|nr:uncharacterized protein LOC119661861 [Teleopsis dalmanni]